MTVYSADQILSKNLTRNGPVEVSKVWKGEGGEGDRGENCGEVAGDQATCLCN